MAALGPLIGENLGVQRAPIEVRDDGVRHSVRIGDTTGFDVEDVVPFGVETGEPARVTGIFHPAGSEFRVAKAKSADISSVRHRIPGQVRHHSRRSSPGPPDGVTASAEGLRPVYAAARTRLGLIALLFVLAVLAWWFTVDRMRGMDAGPGTDLGNACLVPRHLAGDDGRDDVPVGRADGCAVFDA